MSAPAWPLIGHEAAEAHFLNAANSGRLHHAWMIEGPSGIGKAQLARRMSAWLLGARGPADAPLDIGRDDETTRTLLAGSHPDFRWIEREANDQGRMPQFISVDRVRDDVVTFFSYRPALRGFRVCVIDSIDETNASSANALLKTLEEPPANCVLILVSHGTRPVLPTIRSRCRRLRLGRLSDEQVRTVLDQQGVEISGDAIALADGRPGRAMRLSTPEALAAARAVRNLVEGLPRVSDGVLGDVLKAAGAGAGAYEALTSGLLGWAENEAERDPGRAEDWLWMSGMLARARADGMDPVQTTAKLVTGLQERRASR